MSIRKRFHSWPWLTLQIVAANVAIIVALGGAWYLAFMQQSSVYSERLMSTFNIESGALHAMYVEDVERQLWVSVLLGLCVAVVVSIGVAFLIVRPLRSLAKSTERLRHGDYAVRSEIETGEVGRLAENFNALASALEQEEHRRAQYMADLSHELRTPITSLRGYTEGLEDGVFKVDEDYFKLMSGELSHLTALTDTIDAMRLDPTKSDDSGIEDSVAIAELLENARRRWDARFAEQDLHLNISIPKGLKNRHIALSVNGQRQIVDNLLSNMFRYAASEGPCEIKVSKAKQPGFIALEFSNTTPDVDSSSVPFLFDRFFRVSESRTRAHHEHPSGLGLSIVKQLCIANKGSVRASVVGDTLTMELELPLERRKDRAETRTFIGQLPDRQSN